LVARHDDLIGDGVAGPFIGDHHAWSDALLLEQLPQQTLGGCRIAPALDQDVEHDPVLVDGSPEPVLPARDIDHDLIQVPFVPGCRETAADLGGKALAELQRLLPHGFMADHNATGGQHLLDHKAVAGVARGTDRLHPSWIARSGSLFG
jgi:hypothetical protein